MPRFLAAARNRAYKSSVPRDAPQATLTDWHIDDMWGVYPRPSEPIGYGRPHGDGELIAAAHAADLQFVA